MLSEQTDPLPNELLILLELVNKIDDSLLQDAFLEAIADLLANLVNRDAPPDIGRKLPPGHLAFN